MKQGLTQIGIVLDRSGSMRDIRESTIAGFNEFLKQQNAVPGAANVYWAKFDTEYELLYEGALAGAPDLNTENFVPRGGTALHDAIGQTIDHLGKQLKNTPESERAEKVVIVIMTDGLENSSRRYNREQIARMIEHQRNVYKWEFVYLGANQDAVLVGEQMGIPGTHSVMYAATAAGTRSTVSATSSNMASYRSGLIGSMAYSSQQRQEAADDLDENGKPKQPILQGGK